MGEYVDDPTIGDDDDLWRRVPRGWVIFDDKRSRWRPTSLAFRDSRDGSPMSIFLAQVMVAAGRPATDTLRGHQGFHLAAIRAGLARSLDQLIARDPLEDEPAYGVVVGDKRKASRKLAYAATWVIAPPPDFELADTE